MRASLATASDGGITGLSSGADLDPRLALMRQDMAAFASDRGLDPAWRRDESLPDMMFVA